MEDVTLSVASNGRHPILFIPGNPAGKALPRGPLAIVANGRALVAQVAKIAINKATEPEASANILPDVLRGWFGADAGKPGRRERVRLRQAGQHVLLEPVSPVVDTEAQAA
jgi:hypothetical protein